jgi:uncharacterized protein YdhG (YjbR/CyaY superfamily)
MARTAFQSVDEYISSQPEPVQATLQRVRRAIRKALPAAEEAISYQIPAFKLHGSTVVYFAGFKQHYSLYPVTSSVVAALGKEVQGYERSKGTLRFPFSGKVPVRLIARIAKLLAAQAAERASAKKTPKKARPKKRARASGARRASAAPAP